MRLRVLLGAIAIATATAPVATATADETEATFELLAGDLSVSVPAVADLGVTGVDSLVLAGPLGEVTVADDRGLLAGSWIATVESSDFTTGTATLEETILSANVAYGSGTPTTTVGVGAFTPSVALPLATPVTAGAWVGVGANTVTWNPTVTVTLLPGRVAGVYTGTITHSVL